MMGHGQFGTYNSLVHQHPSLNCNNLYLYIYKGIASTDNKHVGHNGRLTGTYYSSILRMGAGTLSNITALALSQVTLISITSHISVPGWTTPSSKCSKPRCSHCSQVAQCTTHNCSICKIPPGITHSAPLAKEENLNTPLLWTGPSHKLNSSLCCCVIQCVTYVYEMECSRDRTRFGSIATFQSLRIFWSIFLT